MNFKKFISGVSAIAIAASAFAAMAVTASAKEYNAQTASLATQNNIQSWASGTITAATWEGDTGFAGAYQSFADLANITYATTVTVEFDAKVFSKTPTRFGVGDASTRTGKMVNANGEYQTTGLALYFGSENGSVYGYRDGSGKAHAINNGYFGRQVHAKFTFNKANKKIEFLLTDIATGQTAASGTYDTNINNLTWVDVYLPNKGSQAQLANIKVSYTVPKTVQVLDKEGFTGAGDTEAAIAKVGIRAIDTIDSITIEANGETKTKYQDKDYVFTTNFNGSEAVISILVNGVSDITSIDIN